MRILADEVRWHLVRALACSDHRVRELVEAVGSPYNLVSYHLKQLKAQGLVAERRSSRDARDVYYSLDLDALRDSYLSSAESIHPAIRAAPAGSLTEADGLKAWTTGRDTVEPAHERSGEASARPAPRVLILCTHNSARSQMAEGILRAMSKGAVDVMSAGSEPTVVNPDAVRAMARSGIDISGQRSKHMDEFTGQAFDYVITVCDSVREVCPVFPGDPERIHWSFADPSEVVDAQEREHAFDQTALGLIYRFRHLLTLIERDHSGTRT